MKFKIALLSVLACCMANAQKQPVDFIINNATVYTVNKNFDKAEAIAVSGGKIVGIGKTAEINEMFTSNDVYDAKNKFIYPGFYDAHAHFYNYGMSLQTVDLRGTKSFEEVIERVNQFKGKKKIAYIQGRGWDQNDWPDREFPNNKVLDIIFPDIPVVLTRIDGHALIANSVALKMAGITTKTKAEGGQIEVKNGALTGILIDNPMELVYNSMPKPSRSEQINALMSAQKTMFEYGLTTINEAGLERDVINLIDSLQRENRLDINIYAMVKASKENLDYYINKGIYKTDKLNVRSFKFMADGALGSRGACLHKPYFDRPKQFGALLSPIEEMRKTAKRIAASDFQMNTHAIGDSTNTVILKIYKEVLTGKKDRRWKIEHAQVLREKDFDYFKSGIIPSVQPTHATSDVYWSTERLGLQRIKNAYAYKKLLDKAGVIALGTDFPVEEVNPMYTFYAAVARKDLKGFPSGGFLPENALTREETLKGMTIWAAYSDFEENEKGSLEVGKWADFTIFDADFMTMPIEQVLLIKPKNTFIKGKQVK
ncbi:Amidohydrolase 3 [Flavobacterium enshiense DK69]|uniref:Amidohydrolase n=1 Tax=Flavobacterium enshiense DK69 TaxID=1107311 RepID=V6S6X3_9FLAO|nr:amidohydrolase [Flavobacterium enshiense]ESU22453.1 Amidohydrolase 3 [Flavobacterium enshiense DK69]KGO97457.1 amidohydrolase [Flavobacterium enshiense DK69]